MLLVRIIGENHLAIRDLEHDDSDHLALKGEQISQEKLVSLVIGGLVDVRGAAVAAASRVG